MSREAWAKCPSRWARVKNSTVAKDNSEGDDDDVMDDDVQYLPSPNGAAPHPSGSGLLPGLSYLRWSEHKGGATAAIILLFALTILSNLAQKGKGLREDNKIAVTYDELAIMTELSRALISRGLKLLQDLGAITSTREGNRCSYELLGIEKNGDWCAVPQGHLLADTDHLFRLKGMLVNLKRASSLHAMKLYMLLLAFRETHSNAARISYQVICQYTGMRRGEISIAVQLLISAKLCRLATDNEIPLGIGQRKHNRYILTGLVAR